MTKYKSPYLNHLLTKYSGLNKLAAGGNPLLEPTLTFQNPNGSATSTSGAVKSSGGISGAGVASAGVGILSDAMSTDFSSGESVQNLARNTIRVGLNAIPVVGTAIAIADTIVDETIGAIANNNESSIGVQLLNDVVNPLDGFTRGIGEISQGQWGKGLGSMVPVYGGLTRAAEAKEMARQSKGRDSAIQSQNAINASRLTDAGNFQTPQAAMGGKLPRYAGGGIMPMINQYTGGGTHEQNTSGYEGIPVDALGNPSAISSKESVATVEQGEVSWVNPTTKSAYVFSNRF